MNKGEPVPSFCVYTSLVDGTPCAGERFTQSAHVLPPVCSAAPQHLRCDLNEKNATQLCEGQQHAAGWRSTLSGNPLEGGL